MTQPLIVSAGEDERAVVAGLRTLLGMDSSALSGATVARDVHTIIGLAASGVGVGLGPSRMRAVPRLGVRFCEVTPRRPPPGLILSFASRDHSPVLRAFPDTIRKNCPDVGADSTTGSGPILRTGDAASWKRAAGTRRRFPGHPGGPDQRGLGTGAGTGGDVMMTERRVRAVPSTRNRGACRIGSSTG
ncbi:hypothetical protein BJ996_006957 [Streptomyces phaeogriseichromatogenes]|nr:hypothetical protein [Streptomyces murinus]BBC91518.1 LysR family transcriptional regulator [Streptomyces rochei]